MSRLNDLMKKDNIDMDMEVFNYGPIVIFKWKNEDGWPVEYVSGNVGINFGYTADSFISEKLNYASIIHPQDLNAVRSEVEEYVRNNQFFIIHKPYRIINFKGEIRWISDYTTILKNDDGEVIGFLGYIYDITDQIYKESSLREVKDRYDHLLDATREGVWDWDLRTDEVFFSKRWKEMLGFQDYEIQGSLLEWEKRVHKEDIAQCYEDIKAHLDGEAIIYENIHRVLHKDGKYLWILDRGIKILDDQGNAYRMIGTHKDITKERELNEQLTKMAKEDSLTGLLNRRSFYEVIHHQIAEAERYDNDLAFIMLDIDHFKKVNDTWGHGFGDVVLKSLASKMEEFLRESDYVFRLGGEEFGILLLQTDIVGAVKFAERLRVEVSEMIMRPTAEEAMSISISSGISSYYKGLGVDGFMENSDEALYEAKENGRNQVKVYNKKN